VECATGWCSSVDAECDVVRDMDEERAQRIFDEAYATLHRTAGTPRGKPRNPVQDIIDNLVPRSSAHQLHYRVQDNRVAVMSQQPEEQQDWSAWNNWCNSLIKAAIEQHQAMIIEAVGQALGEERRKTRETFQQSLAKVERAFKTRIKKLENEITVLRSIKGNVTTIARKAD
jgi:hypothetical protein